MKWFQRVKGSKPPTRFAASGLGNAVEPSEASEHTERSAIPDEMEDETTPAPSADGTGRSFSGRRLTRTVVSPIPAMLAESMGLAEEPDAVAPPKGAETSVSKSSSTTRSR